MDSRIKVASEMLNVTVEKLVEEGIHNLTEKAKAQQNLIDMGVNEAAEGMDGETAYDETINALQYHVDRLKMLRDHKHAWKHYDNGACICNTCGLNGNI